MLKGGFFIPTVKFTLDEAHYYKLVDMAAEEGVSIQDYVRSKLFSLTNIFTPKEAVKRALRDYKLGEYFTLPDLYGEEWTIGRAAGVFGRRFLTYVQRECPNKIVYVKMVDCGRRAQYKVI